MLVVLALGAGLAGFIDTIAGGGGLITLPLLLLSGLPPVAALATNKLQGSFGTLVATLTLLTRRQIVLAEIGLGFVMAFCGGVIGALAVRWIQPKALDVLIPIVLGGIALYFLFAPNAGEIAGRARMAPALYRQLVVPIIGFYDGFFGPGTGSFFALAGVALRGETLLRATAFAKVLNFASNLAAFLIFLLAGKVVWLAGAAMVCGQILGAYAGAHAVIRGGARLIRPLIVVICFAMLARYVWQKGLFSGTL